MLKHKSLSYKRNFLIHNKRTELPKPSRHFKKTQCKTKTPKTAPSQNFVYNFNTRKARIIFTENKCTIIYILILLYNLPFRKSFCGYTRV